MAASPAVVVVRALYRGCLRSAYAIRVETARRALPLPRTVETWPPRIREAFRSGDHSTSDGFSALRALSATAEAVRSLPPAPRSTERTGPVRVSVESRPIGRPVAGRFRFAYSVTVENVSGDRAVRLVARRWHVSDLDSPGRVDEVAGPGVVGKTPLIAPGGRFSYDSWTQISSPVGAMHGSFAMETSGGGPAFDAKIGAFLLMYKEDDVS